MKKPLGFAATLFATLVIGLAGGQMVSHAKPSAAVALIAPTPPMGWNSWDAYGLTIDETQFTANATVLAGLKQYGWQYAVIDEGWYLQNPLAKKPEPFQYALDANGRLVPAVGRFPSAADGAGFKPLADWAHAQGLKFGIHIIRGIPKQAVSQNAPIAGTSFHAADAGDVNDTCPWNPDNYGVRDNPAGQAYYDSIIGLYAAWGVDFLKVDCIASHPYKADEIRMIAAAIKKSGIPIVLSLSPGPTSLANAVEVGEHAQMWRIADDIWDGWDFSVTLKWPNGLLTAFDNLAKWAPYAKPGNWPDADMLPWGSLTPHPGWGDPRQSRLTKDEEQTQFTLWAITRTPMILGGNLTVLDDFTKSLITNKAVIALNQTAYESHPVKDLPAGWENARAWMASGTANGSAVKYIAIFNLDDKPATFAANWKQFGLKAGLVAHNLLNGNQIKTSANIEVTLPAHGSVLYRVDTGRVAKMFGDTGVGCNIWCN